MDDGLWIFDVNFEGLKYAEFIQMVDGGQLV